MAARSFSLPSARVPRRRSTLTFPARRSRDSSSADPVAAPASRRRLVLSADVEKETEGAEGTVERRAAHSMGRRTKAKAVAAPSSQPSRGGQTAAAPLRTRERRASRMSQGREGPSPSLSPSPSPPEMAGGGIRRTAGTLSLPGRPRGRPAGLRLCLPLPQRLRLQLRIPHRTAAPRGTTIRSRSKGAGAGAGEGFGGHGGGSMGMKVLHLYICQYSSQLGLDDGPVLEAHQAGDTAPAALRCPGSRDKVVRTRSPPPDPDPSWRRARFDTAFSASGTRIVI